MAFWNKILKKKKEEAVSEKPHDEQREKHGTAEQTSGEAKLPPRGGKVILGVLYAPHTTEKTTAGAKENKYTFRVSERANKIEIKRAIASRYGVTVERVNVVHTRPKERKRGKQIGWKPGFKKAIVTVTEGQTIEIQ